MMVLNTRLYINVYLFSFLAGILLFGCGGDKQKTIIETTDIINPTDRVEQYIRLVYKTNKRDEAYQFLMPESRERIPVKDFKSLLHSELSDVLLTRSSSEIEVRVDHLKDFPIDDNHRIIYSLVRLSFPYDFHSEDMFRLTKFHAYRVSNTWFIEPFIHRETFTKRMVPSLMIGYQRELQEKRTQFYDIIGQDLLKERKDYQTISETKESNIGFKEAEKVGTLVVPDLRKDSGESVEIEKEESSSDFNKPDKANTLASLLAVGRLHYQIGNIAAAEKAFRKVLEMDPINETAKEFLAKCEDIRNLQDEKKKQIELYEKLLELDEKEEELKTKSEEK